MLRLGVSAAINFTIFEGSGFGPVCDPSENEVFCVRVVFLLLEGKDAGDSFRVQKQLCFRACWDLALSDVGMLPDRLDRQEDRLQDASHVLALSLQLLCHLGRDQLDEVESLLVLVEAGLVQGLELMERVHFRLVRLGGEELVE